MALACLSLLLYFPFFIFMSAAQSFQDLCLSFTPRAAQNASIGLVNFIPRNTSVSLDYRDPTCGGPGKSSPTAQDLCRVAMSIKTSNQSGIQFEAWLPKEWNGRFLATGNGGIGGCIDYASMSYGTKHGFAAVGSNNGHNGTTGKAFYHNADVVADFAGRSLHTSVLAGKATTKEFYGKSPQKSYYLGCSQGGRQGVGSAEKYPTDFDGIVAGSPALDFNNLISWRAHFFPLTGASNSTDFIKTSTWTGLIHDEVLKQCDELDGVKDGIIEYPDKCQFRPEKLLCQASTTENCLSLKQVDEVRGFFSPFTHNNGSVIYSAMDPGSEKFAIARLYAGKPFSDSQDWFRYVVYSNPDWDPAAFTTRDAAAAEAMNPSNIRTFPSNLSTFRNTNGKLLVYHGQQDQQITPLNTERWYDHLEKGMNTTSEQLDSFMRFFRISGMNHCNGGPGAWMFGQTDQKGVPFDRKSNVLAAIVQWVENGTAPETFEGTKYVNDSMAAGVEFRRRHCRYPLQNTFKSRSSESGFISKSDTGIQITAADDWQCI